MADDPLAGLDGEEFLGALSSEEKDALRLRHHVKSGDDVVWIEPEGRLRKEKASSLYYIRTPKGVFRVSRLTDEIVEV